MTSALRRLTKTASNAQLSGMHGVKLASSRMKHAKKTWIDLLEGSMNLLHRKKSLTQYLMTPASLMTLETLQTVLSSGTISGMTAAIHGSRSAWMLP